MKTKKDSANILKVLEDLSFRYKIKGGGGQTSGRMLISANPFQPIVLVRLALMVFFCFMKLANLFLLYFAVLEELIN